MRFAITLTVLILLCQSGKTLACMASNHLHHLNEEKIAMELASPSVTHHVPTTSIPPSTVTTTSSTITVPITTEPVIAVADQTEPLPTSTTAMPIAAEPATALPTTKSSTSTTSTAVPITTESVEALSTSTTAMPITAEPTTALPTTESSTSTTSTTSRSTTITTEATTTVNPVSPKILHESQCTAYPCLFFDEEFNTLNTTLWKHTVGPWKSGCGFSYFVNQRNVTFVQDGIFYMVPYLPSNPVNHSYPVYTAQMQTSSAFSFRYAKVEVISKMPVGDWQTPAFWFVPVGKSPYGTSPADGEIDLAISMTNEVMYYCNPSKGGKCLVNKGQNQIQSGTHQGPNSSADKLCTAKIPNTYNLPNNAKFSDNFYNFTMIWNISGIWTFVDGAPALTLPTPSNGFWNFCGFSNLTGVADPWVTGGLNAPFDQYFMMRIDNEIADEIYGAGYYYPGYPNNAMPWQQCGNNSVAQFLASSSQWLPGWPTLSNLDQAWQIQSVKMWKMSENDW